jgi:diguanylate cyclase (GGDEF)-like protein
MADVGIAGGGLRLPGHGRFIRDGMSPAAAATPAPDRPGPRTWPLRSVFALGGAVLTVVLLLALAFFHRAIGALSDEQTALAAHHERVDELLHRATEALVADAAPATDPVLALSGALVPADAAVVAPALEALAAASTAWRTAATAPGATLSDPAVRERARAVSGAVTAVRRTLAERRLAEVARRDALARRNFGLGLATAGVGVVLGVLFLSIVLRHTVRPLTTLAHHAGAETPVPDDVGLRVTEVKRMARALRHLQTQAHERQLSLEQSRSRAVQLSRFAELVQGTSRPLEIRTGMATMLEGALADGEVQIIEWNEGQTRLHRTWPEVRGEGGDVALDPATCPAIRRKRAVRAEVPSDTACDCAFGAPEHGTYACIPMLSAGAVSGLVNIRTARRPAWTRSDVVGAQAYVNFASSALGSIYVLESTRDRALKDGLTGAYNRRFLDEYLMKRLADCVRHQQTLSVLLLDLDHFKNLNDTYGHAIGDRALVEFAAMVHAQIRTGDAFVRYGGEEFVLVLSSTELDGAMIVAERIRARSERIVIDITGDQPPPKVTTSIGVATASVHGSTMPELMAAADRAVYRAKALGRNRVVAAEAPPATIAAVP